jgi:hypothetical protein
VVEGHTRPFRITSLRMRLVSKTCLHNVLTLGPGGNMTNFIYSHAGARAELSIRAAA